jgi:hypothetical protein
LFFENFNYIKDYISNSNALCRIMKLIIRNSSMLLKKLVRITDDIPDNVLDLNEENFLEEPLEEEKS